MTAIDNRPGIEINPQPAEEKSRKKPLMKSTFRRRFKEEKYSAAHDKLTGLLNRRGFDERFDQEVEKAKANGTRLEVLYMDLNGLKEINDLTKNHAQGDKLLIDTARSLLSSIRTAEGRPMDIVARVGGDEFVVVLSGAGIESLDNSTNLPFSKAYCERLIPSLEEKGISLSIGIDRVNLNDPRTSVANADALMYEAKTRSKTSRKSEIVFSQN